MACSQKCRISSVWTLNINNKFVYISIGKKSFKSEDKPLTGELKPLR